MTTECYLEMADRLYEFNWYELSIDLKKYFILMMGNMQIPLYYHGSGMIVINLKTFQEVRNNLVIDEKLILKFKLQIYLDIP